MKRAPWTSVALMVAGLVIVFGAVRLSTNGYDYPILVDVGVGVSLLGLVASVPVTYFYLHKLLISKPDRS